VIKSLGAVASSMVCRDVYYPGAKHLVEILQLLIPGIDLVRSCHVLFVVVQLIFCDRMIPRKQYVSDLTDDPNLVLTAAELLAVYNSIPS